VKARVMSASTTPKISARRTLCPSTFGAVAVLLSKQHRDPIAGAGAEQQRRGHTDDGQRERGGDGRHAVGADAAPHDDSVRKLVKSVGEEAGDGRQGIADEQTTDRLLAHVS